MPKSSKIIPIYISSGDVGGYLVYPYLYNVHGEWIGWVSEDRSVYSVYGQQVGTLSKEPRILRPREWHFTSERRQPPAPPPPFHPPVRSPLPPLMAEISQNLIDVLEEAPQLLPPLGSGDLNNDMD